ncbi:hypothetical protein F4V43_09725 [Paenibacillus spiritus]|uniref:Zinc finger CGNR domain-containing protein n=1 Tax=Paenibacillus spiritus TaxID=2496557 RepID=A0A5J5G9W6_9BACL|nr:CGNR zinc finger domain-containing protein [Paenibacillus spiritus]KAA9004896.1 hypothetical protein F4V43_09725 [Paenibacillus spiritus]
MLWADFINSYARDWRTGDERKAEDRLLNREWVRRWLAGNHLPPLEAPEEDELAELQRLRSALFAIVRTLAAGGSLSEEQLALLNREMALGPALRRIAADPEGRLELVSEPLRDDWAQVRAEIAASLAEAVTTGDPSRFGVCENPDCQWVYYDDTRNRSKRYCEDKTCGNLLKVRRFRARKKAEAASPPPAGKPREE